MNKLGNKKQKFVILLFCLISLFFVLSPIITSAKELPKMPIVTSFKGFFTPLEYAGNEATYNVDAQGTDNYVNNLISNIIKIVISLTGSIFLILIIYSGIQWMTAGGEEEKLAKAKDHIKNAIIGLALCLFAFGITSFVNNFIESRFLTNPDNSSTSVQLPAGETVLCQVDYQCSDRPFKYCYQGECVQCLSNEKGCDENSICSSETHRCIRGSNPCSSINNKADCLKDNNCNYIKDYGCQMIVGSACKTKCTDERKNVCDSSNGQCVQECTLSTQCLGLETCNERNICAGMFD
jgi:hypothetical protein